MFVHVRKKIFNVQNFLTKMQNVISQMCKCAKDKCANLQMCEKPSCTKCANLQRKYFSKCRNRKFANLHCAQFCLCKFSSCTSFVK